MPGTEVTLGPFTFEGFEVPDRIVLKSKQRLFVHHLGSGTTLTDSLGTEHQIISFGGTFTGHNATNRIRMLDQLRSQGGPLVFRWDSQILIVTIQEFELNYKSGQWIDYKLSCPVVEATAIGPEETDAVLHESVPSQVKSVLALLKGTGVSTTIPQTGALTILAQGDFDDPPLDKLQFAYQLRNSIQRSLLETDGNILDIMVSDPDSPLIVSKNLVRLFENIGQSVSLTVAHTRLLGIIARVTHTQSS